MQSTYVLVYSWLIGCMTLCASDVLRSPHGAQFASVCAAGVVANSSSCSTSCQVSVTTNLFLQSVLVTVSVTEVGSPALLNLTVTGTFSSGSACATDVTAAGLRAIDNVAANYFANFYDYEIVANSNRLLFPTFGNEFILTATDVGGNDRFGFAVALSGDASTLVVGAPGANGARGNMYIFERQPVSWAQVFEVADPAGLPNDLFGSQVAVAHDGSVIAVSNGASGTSSVYLYSYSPATNTLTLDQTLTGVNGFGSRIALSASGQYLVIANTASAPSLFVYVRQNSCAGLGATWALQQTFSTQVAQLGGLAISGDGSIFSTGLFPAGTPGLVDIFAQQGSLWNLVQTVTASDGAVNDKFGVSVSLSGSGKYLIAGASSHAGGGKAYEFVRRGQTWLQENTFLPTGSASAFGAATAISADGTVALIGDNAANSSLGALYVELRSPDNHWSQQFVFTGTANTSLGYSVAISDDGAFLAGGAPFLLGPGFGSVYMLSPIGSLISSDAIVTGSLCVFNQTTVNGDLFVTGSIFTNGFVVSGGVTPCIASDKYIKKDIRPLTGPGALYKLSMLRPVTFTWKHPEEHRREGENPAGFIAQEVREHFPQWIRYKQPSGADAQCIPSGELALHLAISPEILAYLVAAIKHLHTVNDEQRAALYEYVTRTPLPKDILHELLHVLQAQKDTNH